MNTRKLREIGCGIVIAVFLAGCLIFGFGMLGITSPGAPALGPVSDASSSPEVLAYDRSITLDVPLPASPATVPFYRVVSVQKFSAGTGTALAVKKHIPSVADAPGLAEKILGEYGGLPADAVLENTEQVFMKKYNLKTGTVEEQYPQYTRVAYSHYVNGSPVMGSGIAVSLGEDGELLDISKDWRTLEYAGEVPVLSVHEAWEKLQARDLLIPIQSSLNGYHITRIQSGYHVETHLPDASMPMATPNQCTPVWIFYGIKPGTDGKPFPLLVNATRG
jgi:hypothetical protein